MDALQKQKEDVEARLAGLEKQIHLLETAYLEKTSVPDGGNIIRGWESLLSTSGLPATTRGGVVREGDRIFSMSSVTGPLAFNSTLQQLQQLEQTASPRLALGEALPSSSPAPSNTDEATSTYAAVADGGGAYRSAAADKSHHRKGQVGRPRRSSVVSPTPPASR